MSGMAIIQSGTRQEKRVSDNSFNGVEIRSVP